MDSYPQDLLVGVFPLVFAVNAILRGEGAADAPAEDTSTTRTRNRSLFDRFLDAIAASLINDLAESGGEDAIMMMGGDLSNNSHGHQSNKNRTVSIFQPNEDDYSSDEDEIDDLFAGGSAASAGSSSNMQHAGGGGGGPFRRKRGGGGAGGNTTTGGIYPGFVRNSFTNRATSHPSTTGSSGSSSHYTSYAKALSMQQDFFAQARIESVSTRHGFPPSKDPQGQENLALGLSNVLNGPHVNQQQNLKTLLERHENSLQGILPAGWLEKHVHALPSVILVVCTVCSSQKDQAAQDEYLFQTLEHLASGGGGGCLVPKRRCTIQVIGLMQNDVTMIQGDGWCRAVTQHVSLQPAPESIIGGGGASKSSNPSGSTTPYRESPIQVSLLRASADLEPNNTGLPTSPALQRLHDDVRHASMRYYLSQARRTKHKLAQLILHEKSSTGGRRRGGPLHPQQQQEEQYHNIGPPDPLLPLVIRYCFKIALFYEFQGKHEKSLRYMAEGHRYAGRYYHYLSTMRRPEHASTPSDIPESNNNNNNNISSDDDDDDDDTTATYPTHSVAESHDSVEVALSDSSSGNPNHHHHHYDNHSHAQAAFWQSVVPAPPKDMIYQCRAVADWLNLKLLTAGFSSQTEGGLLAAASQWREHARVFCTVGQNAQSLLAAKDSSSSIISSSQQWLEWSYIARQRIVMSELVERHAPSKILGTLITSNSQVHDEVIQRFSAWRTAESAVESLLRLAREVDKVRGHSSTGSSASSEDSKNTSTSLLRPPFVGGLQKEGLDPLLQDECQVNHREKALKLILRAISLFEQELIRDKRGFYAEDSFNEGMSCRTGARLYYLAGGILLGMGQHREAASHLEKATKYSQGWRELELAVRKLLIECYEKHLPVQQRLDTSSSPSAPSTLANANSDESQTMASIILDSYFNAEMSSSQLRRALRHFASMSGGGDKLKWYRASYDDEDPSLPFSFEVTFPQNIFATVGDAVKASVLIKSNLDYAVHINSVVLVSLAGHLPIPSNDLMQASNASEGSEGGIIIQRNGEIVITTEVVLPRDLSIIAADDSGNGGQLQGTAGKGSFAKSARPRTAGMTSAAGARLLSADQLGPENKVTQGWSMRFLGGKPVKCDGLQLVFYPVQVEKASGSVDNVTLIELLVEKKKPRTAANIKRTPFEEENYIASGWSRPLRLPFSRGPRSLRVLGPQPQMVVTNMTEDGTGGKALEGTVNRILLKLHAGPNERCTNVSVRVSCFTVLMSPTGVTKRLVSDQEINEESAETSVNMKLPIYRTPVLVTPNSASSDAISTEYGYSLPAGWSLAESGQGFSDKKIPPLKGGEATFLHLDFFRPASVSVEKENSIDASDNDQEESNLCKTDFYITVSYRQERPSTQKRSSRARRVVRRKPVMKGGGTGQEGSAQPDDSAGASDDPTQSKDESSDEVSLEYSGTIVWEKPISASFSPGVRKSQPSGIRHASNAVEGSRQRTESDADLVVVNGESVTTKCTLRPETNATEVKTEIVGIRFQSPTISTAPVDYTLKSSHNRRDDKSVIYQSTPNDPCRVLNAGSAFSVAYTVQARLKEAENASSVTGPLGALLVDWSPAPLELPFEVDRSGTLGAIDGHGPLALGRPSTVRFPGPRCHIEHAPFEVELLELPASPRVAVPFEVNIRIKNRTSRHQALTVRVSEQAPSSSDGLLVSGLIDGQFSLAPSESQILSYTVMATRPGKTVLPMLLVSAPRFRTWVVREASNKCFQLYIFP